MHPTKTVVDVEIDEHYDANPEDVKLGHWGAKIYWVGGHVGIFLILIYQNTEIHRKLLEERDYTYFFIFCFCIICCAILYFLVSYINPGFITKGDVESQMRPLHNITPIIEDDPSIITMNDDMEQRNEALMDCNLRFCKKCDIVQPLRTKHCKECGLCVLRFDHHCFFVGTCVGQKNHLCFWCYLAVESIVIFWGLVASFKAFNATDSISSWFSQHALILPTTIVLIFSFALSFGLFAYHSYLILTNQTTWEAIKRDKISYLKDINPSVFPFDEGIINNIKYFLTMHKKGPTWEVPENLGVRVQQKRFNIWVNDYWSCF